ncbi:30S ribosomal protein S9, mitochondrial [Lotus japonicus]|uniref:30S ribosomal protein S9, mitochondrial n=1 Tax=Lotus japonicus TaxID=34305 RepID=UPI0025911C42|nr:30S ribosomal protein S9, mitochondrial [Lotus japonicus]
MLSRLIPKPSHLRRFFTLPSKQPHFANSPINPFFTIVPKPFSSRSNNNNSGNGNGNGRGPFTSGTWGTLGDENEEKFDAFFTEDSGSLPGLNEAEGGTGEGIGDSTVAEKEEPWWLQEKGLDDKDEVDIFKGIDKETEGGGNVGFGDSGGDQIGVGAESENFQPWSLKEEEEGEVDVFKFPEDVGPVEEFGAVDRTKEEAEKLEKEEQALTAIVKGPKHAFGDLIAASGITDEMLDSLIALKDFEGIEGLPPLSVIEDMRYEKNTSKSTRAEIERLKQEEAAKARVRQVDEKGRAYGTGRRKCSIARVWVQPGCGKFVVNEKEFDVYFPMLEHRATLLRPFSETKTLGLWDVTCTVKGGGVSGQVGAIRLGISKALQNWEPDLRPPLRNAGFLTRDSRVVERKKPGKAKARKSFQWVKR